MRLRAGLILALIVVLTGGVIPAVFRGAMIFGASLGVVSMLTSAVAALAIVIWWLLFSRAPWMERIAGVILMPLAIVAMRPLVHESIAGAGMARLYPILSILVMTVMLVAWAVVSRGWSTGWRRASMPLAFLLGCALFAVVRTGGISGGGKMDLHWRWTPTPEDRLLAVDKEPKPSPPQVAPALPPPAAAPATPPAEQPQPAQTAEASAASAPVVTRAAEWPGFRGPNRDGVVRNVRIETDWSKSAPVELWRRPIGPGWSSFAVQGDLIYTQEQRGEEEVVSCYRFKTGDPVWRHRDRVRFWESNAGAGPRATPTLHNGRVYTMGATGVVNALDAFTGSRYWTRNAAVDTKKEIPDWGIASSPVVVDDLVIVAAAGHLAAYDIATGNPRWFGPTGGGGYSSPHIVTLHSVPQVLLLRGGRTISLSPKDGKLLWEHNWQPAVTSDGDVLIGVGDAMGGLGLRRLAISKNGDTWKVEERWTSRGLKPYFNDFVLHKGHAYGFDGSILSCIDLSDGNRKWKGGRYGNGQLVLLADQDLLLVLSEDGELALVKATSDGYTEVAKVPALDGKTWNHPVVVRNVLLVRNAEQMAAYRLPRAAAETSKLTTTPRGFALPRPDPAASALRTE